MTQLLHMRAVCSRYGISDRTVDRWIEAGELPKPMYIQGRRYCWSEDQLDQHDAARKTEAAA
jgi:excisionase family DNA binding protein